LALIRDEPPRPDAIASARDAIARALVQLESLPPKERVAFAMFRIDQVPIEEIARTMGHTKGYVSKLISRAEARLREVLA
jgi:RNA polymerase sigma-70 factor (ECF subfamily)